MDASDSSFWDRMIERQVSRRTLIKATAAAVVGAASGARLPGLLGSTCGEGGGGGLTRLRMEHFTPIGPSTEDEFVLPPEFTYQVLVRWNDPIHDRGDRFGFNCDFTAFFPLSDGKRTPAGAWSGADGPRFAPERSGAEGLYVVNHEFPDPKFIPRIADQQEAVGLSVVHLRRDRSGHWRVQLHSPYARRYSARSPARLSGPAAGLAGRDGMVVGTLGNCSGGVTPWGTVLTCEEHTEGYGEAVEDGGYGWSGPYREVSHYSWVVEIDPYDPDWVPLKRTALGRFRHENVALRVAADGRLVAYMGDDANNCFVYKYVSAGRYDPARGLANGELLDEGRLHVAHFREEGSGSWTPLPMTEECLRDTHRFIVQQGLAATPMDRPEDLEVHPLDGSVYVALTHNTAPGPGRVIPPPGPDPYGKIVRLRETGDDPAAPTFSWVVFAVGGLDAGFASPDNLHFDRAGNLWIVTDFASGRGEYAAFGNNGMAMVPTSGKHAGIAFQFASGPVGCELAGPWLSPDETALFLAVQHPGEGSVSVEAPDSHWPDGRGIPKPSCVVIRRRAGSAV
jgi:secreted PhoX family phosphatase